MQAKCDSLRKLVMKEMEKKRNGEKINHVDVAKKFNIHPNTVGKYVRQSKALEASIPDVVPCIDQLGIPGLYLYRLSLNSDSLHAAMGGRASIDGKRASDLPNSSLYNYNNQQWITYNGLWFRDDATLDDKRTLLRVAAGESRQWFSETDLQECIKRVGIDPSELHVLTTPQLSITGLTLLRTLNAYDTLGGRRAVASTPGARLFYDDTWWVTKGQHWVQDDDKSGAKEVILQVGMRLMPVPQAKKGGGLVASTMKLSKQHKIFFTQVLHASTLSLLNAAEYIRVHVDNTFPAVSETTLYNVAKAMGFTKKRSSSFDPKKVAILAKELEEKVFHHEIQSDKGVLRGENLLFMDESNFYLNMDEDPGASWGKTGKNAVDVPLTKGKSQYLSLILTVGLVFNPENDYGGSSSNVRINPQWISDWQRLKESTQQPMSGDIRDNPTAIGGWSLVDGTPANLDAHLLLFWHIVPPMRKPHLGVFYEFDEPFTQEEETYWKKVCDKIDKMGVAPRNMDITTASHKRLVERTLFYLGVDSRAIVDNNVDTHQLASENELKRRFVELVVHKRRKDLPRRFVGPKYKGGSPQPELSTTSKFMHYLKTLSSYTQSCFGKEVLGDSRVFLDNAPTHGRVNVDSNAASFLHAYAKSIDFEGAVFPPSLSPKYNVAEVVFAYIKTLIRNAGMPPSGQHSVASMTDMIETALMQVTPAMVAAWTLSRGYRFNGAIASNQMPVGLFTQPIPSSTGSVVFGTGKYTNSLRATGEVDPRALRLAYHEHDANDNDAEDNTAIVDQELQKTEKLVYAVAQMRFEYQDAAMASASDEVAKRLTRHVQSTFGDFIEQLPLYTATYAELATIMGKIDRQDVERQSLDKYVYSKMPIIPVLTWSQLDDVLLVLAEVVKYHSKAIKQSKGSSSQLCALGVQDACDKEKDSTASRCARTFPSRHNDIVCMTEMGQIANSARVSQQSRQPHKRFGANMGRMQQVFNQTARLIGIRGTKLTVSNILDLVPYSDAYSLRPFAEQVIKFIEKGALRPPRTPCAKTLTSERSRTFILIRDWNGWVPIGADDLKHTDISITRLKEYNYPEYELQGTSDEFETNNQWGNMIIEITPKDGSAAALLYTHVGFSPTERLRQIALSSMDKEQLKSLGADVIDVNREETTSYHLQTRAHLPLWIVENLKSKLNAAAADPSLLRRTDGSDGLYSQIWNHYCEKVRSADLSLYDDISPTDQGNCDVAITPRCSNFRRLRRLMLDMQFPGPIVKAAHFYNDVSKSGQVPMFSAGKIRSKARWEKEHAGDRSVQIDTNGPQRRWPGYPMITYSHGLQSVRDVYWVTEDDGVNLKVYIEKYKADGGINQEALYVLEPFRNYIGTVFLQLHDYKAFFRHDELVPFELGKAHDRFPQIRKLLTRKVPINIWEKDDVKLWNELLHEEVGSEIPDQDVLVYPAVLFLTVGEYRRYRKDSEKLTDVISLFLWKYVNSHFHDKYTPSSIHLNLRNSITHETKDDEWIVYLPSHLKNKSVGNVSFAVIQANGITLNASIGTIESKLRVGMPWDFVRRAELKHVKDMYNGVVRVYEIEEFSAIDAIGAIDVLSKLYSAQASEYMARPSKSQEDEAFLKEAVHEIQRVASDIKHKINKHKLAPENGSKEFIREFQKRLNKKDYVEQNNDLTFWPTVGDMRDYYVIESMPDNEQSGTKYSIQYISDIEDTWVKAMVSICQQRNNQRRNRSARVPAQVNAAAPQVVKKIHSFDALPYRHLWLIAERTEDGLKLNAFSLTTLSFKAFHKQIKLSDTFRLYRREDAVDETSPGSFRRISDSVLTFQQVFEALPEPWFTSRDKLTRAYGASKYASLELAIKGLLAYDNYPEFVPESVCLVYSGKIWIPESIVKGSRVIRPPLIRVRQGGAYFQLMFFVKSDNVRRAHGPTTEWYMDVAEIKALGLPVVIVKSTYSE